MDSNAWAAVPIFCTFCIFGLPVIAWLVVRGMAHRERMEMMRHGFAPNTGDARRWAASAIPSGPPPAEPDWSLQAAHCALRRGIIVTMVGFAVTLGLSFIGYDGGAWRPGPWLLGGLVPMFVGIAQVMIALLSGATLGPQQQNWTAGHGSPPPYAQSPGQSNPPPTFDNSYTYRPGTTQELRPPSSPPDRI